MLTHLDKILDLVDQGALFTVNHSGGKDSQAMLALIRQVVPAKQIVVVHAPLGDIEWEGVQEHIENTIGDLPLILAKPHTGWWDMIARRGYFPSPSYRQCTSDLKRTPIEREIRRHSKATGQTLIVNCVGLRAEESTSRAKAETWKVNKDGSKAGRTWFEWLPIHTLTIDQVWKIIASVGQKPHWAYEAGMSRLSCSFCIMASAADLTLAAKLRPGLYRKYCQAERDMDQTFVMPRKGIRRFLPEVTGIAIPA